MDESEREEPPDDSGDELEHPRAWAAAPENLTKHLELFA
jgi:hypothetical protein